MTNPGDLSALSAYVEFVPIRLTRRILSGEPPVADPRPRPAA